MPGCKDLTVAVPHAAVPQFVDLAAVSVCAAVLACLGGQISVLVCQLEGNLAALKR